MAVHPKDTPAVGAVGGSAVRQVPHIALMIAMWAIIGQPGAIAISHHLPPAIRAIELREDLPPLIIELFYEFPTVGALDGRFRHGGYSLKVEIP